MQNRQFEYFVGSKNTIITIHYGMNIIVYNTVKLLVKLYKEWIIGILMTYVHIVSQTS